MVKIISWNIAQREAPWRCLVESDADIGLLQEAAEPPLDVSQKVGVTPASWRTGGGGKNRPWRTAVIKLTDDVEVEWFETKSLDDAQSGELAVSRTGTLAAATVTPSNGAPFIVISTYAVWENPHAVTGSGWIYADASVHRLISDLSVFIGQQEGHSVLVAGDLNILHGYGEWGSAYWASRYASIFNRMSVLGLSFVGPQSPDGRRADPWPDELPSTSNNVPTYHSNRQTPATATRQLDFVFASNGLAERVRVRAANKLDRWGPSDHCRLEIEVS